MMWPFWVLPYSRLRTLVVVEGGHAQRGLCRSTHPAPATNSYCQVTGTTTITFMTATYPGPHGNPGVQRGTYIYEWLQPKYLGALHHSRRQDNHPYLRRDQLERSWPELLAVMPVIVEVEGGRPHTRHPGRDNDCADPKPTSRRHR